MEKAHRIIATYSVAARLSLALMLFRIQIEHRKRYAFAVWQLEDLEPDGLKLDSKGSRPRAVTKERNPLMWADREVGGDADKMIQIASELEQVKQEAHQETDLLAALLRERQSEVETLQAAGEATRQLASLQTNVRHHLRYSDQQAEDKKLVAILMNDLECKYSGDLAGDPPEVPEIPQFLNSGDLAGDAMDRGGVIMETTGGTTTAVAKAPMAQHDTNPPTSGVIAGSSSSGKALVVPPRRCPSFEYAKKALWESLLRAPKVARGFTNCVWLWQCLFVAQRGVLLAAVLRWQFRAGTSKKARAFLERQDAQLKEMTFFAIRPVNRDPVRFEELSLRQTELSAPAVNPSTGLQDISPSGSYAEAAATVIQAGVRGSGGGTSVTGTLAREQYEAGMVIQEESLCVVAAELAALQGGVMAGVVGQAAGWGRQRGSVLRGGFRTR